ncbi:hypothetical protein K9L05_02455 [Candidatus Babeliales bacterium]|nr:hypothetical protein [Candidatus Babeliales bacterium]MCF7899487.1 hypothetical protein [Candidatus Babeliales bacterium]
MVDDLKEYDQRQYNLMLQKIDFYENKKLDLSIISDLESLLSFLNEKDVIWEKEIINLCGKLDYYNLNLNDASLDIEIRNQQRKYIDESINRLIELIKQKILKK